MDNNSKPPIGTTNKNLDDFITGESSDNTPEDSPQNESDIPERDLDYDQITPVEISNPDQINETVEPEPEKPLINLEKLIEKTGEALHSAYSKLTDLSIIKRSVFHPEKIDDGHRKNVHEIVNDISTRHFGTVEYHNEIEKYNDAPDDTSEVRDKKRSYRKAILYYAQQLGFLGNKPLEPTNDFEKKMNLSSNPEPYDGEVEAIVVPGAAALSNYKRFYHAIKSISTGAIKTNKIVFATCGRQTTDAEKKTMQNAGYGECATEFDLEVQAVQDIAGGFINEPVETQKIVNLNGNEYPVRVLTGFIRVNNDIVTVCIVESPYDTTRRDERGNLAKRANTEETFFSTMTVLDDQTPNKTLCITSHDTWKPCQHVAAEYIFGGYFGKNIISSGPDNCDRLQINEDGELDINMAEAVVDEMSKYLDELEKLDVFLAEQNILRLFNKTMSDKHKILFTNKIVRGLGKRS